MGDEILGLWQSRLAGLGTRPSAAYLSFAEFSFTYLGALQTPFNPLLIRS